MIFIQTKTCQNREWGAVGVGGEGDWRGLKVLAGKVDKQRGCVAGVCSGAMGQFRSSFVRFHVSAAGCFLVLS